MLYPAEATSETAVRIPYRRHLSKSLALAVVSLLIVVWINERFSRDFRKSICISSKIKPPCECNNCSLEIWNPAIPGLPIPYSGIVCDELLRERLLAVRMPRTERHKATRPARSGTRTSVIAKGWALFAPGCDGFAHPCQHATSLGVRNRPTCNHVEIGSRLQRCGTPTHAKT